MEETQKKILFEIMIGSATKENILYFQGLIAGFEIPIADLERYCNYNCIFNDMKICRLNGPCKLVEYIEEIKGRVERYILLHS